MPFSISLTISTTSSGCHQRMLGSLLRFHKIGLHWRQGPRWDSEICKEHMKRSKDCSLVFSIRRCW